jgi:hypothetical protein
VATSPDELLAVLTDELSQRGDWLLHEQDAVDAVWRRLGCDPTTARGRFKDLVAARLVVRHRPRCGSRPADAAWAPRREQDCYSLASAPRATRASA